ncbi:hypothetical protein FO441_08910 [Salinicoccus cyprini]|uniref:Septum formation initiator family protein n=1 Tax=Salinicoccus cyprini TaxID=2493691 RepID=A0A558AU78_9STAP|nr:hypothetical protein [Salinicoccus cyprini]TVT27815.1 hypothetical protein FO441_08910 [Salinicoccus cyprini]
MWWIVMIVLIAVASGFGSDYMKHKRKMEQIRVDVLNKEIELEQLRQENYLLENRSMLEELEKIRAENRLSYEKDENRRWLIEETKTKEN